MSDTNRDLAAEIRAVEAQLSSLRSEQIVQEREEAAARRRRRRAARWAWLDKIDITVQDTFAASCGPWSVEVALVTNGCEVEIWFNGLEGEPSDRRRVLSLRCIDNQWQYYPCVFLRQNGDAKDEIAPAPIITQATSLAEAVCSALADVEALLAQGAPGLYLEIDGAQWRYRQHHRWEMGAFAAMCITSYGWAWTVLNRRSTIDGDALDCLVQANATLRAELRSCGLLH